MCVNKHWFLECWFSTFSYWECPRTHLHFFLAPWERQGGCNSQTSDCNFQVENPCFILPLYVSIPSKPMLVSILHGQSYISIRKILHSLFWAQIHDSKLCRVKTNLFHSVCKRSYWYWELISSHKIGERHALGLPLINVTIYLIKFTIFTTSSNIFFNSTVLFSATKFSWWVDQNTVAKWHRVKKAVF